MYNGSMPALRPTLRTVHSLTTTAVIIASTLLVVANAPISASATNVALASCEGTDLVGAFVRNQVATGHVVTTIAITNVGSAMCALGGYPTLIGLRGANKYGLHVSGHGTYAGNLHPINLAPRMSGGLIVSTGDLCGPTYGVLPPSEVYSGMIVVLPKDEGTVQVLGASFDTTCGLYVSQLGWRKNFSLT
jgi:hypothetical protein